MGEIPIQQQAETDQLSFQYCKWFVTTYGHHVIYRSPPANSVQGKGVKLYPEFRHGMQPQKILLGILHLRQRSNVENGQKIKKTPGLAPSPWIAARGDGIFLLIQNSLGRRSGESLALGSCTHDASLEGEQKGYMHMNRMTCWNMDLGRFQSLPTFIFCNCMTFRANSNLLAFF